MPRGFWHTLLNVRIGAEEEISRLFFEILYFPRHHLPG
jgi:hypothetical protein